MTRGGSTYLQYLEYVEQIQINTTMTTMVHKNYDTGGGINNTNSLLVVFWCN